MTDNRTLSISRIIDAPPQKVFDAWTQPELMKQWFAPAPFTTPSVKVDLRVGGKNEITMRSPDGQDMPNVGVYLEIVPGKKLVFTDGFVDAWIPSENPMFTAVLTFEDAPGGKTKYTATAHHWTAEACKMHAEMGFVEGWSQCAQQLEDLLKSKR